MVDTPSVGTSLNERDGVQEGLRAESRLCANADDVWRSFTCSLCADEFDDERDIEAAVRG